MPTDRIPKQHVEKNTTQKRRNAIAKKKEKETKDRAQIILAITQYSYIMNLLY